MPRRRLGSLVLAAFLALGGPGAAQDSLYGQDTDGDGLADGFEDMNGNGVMDGEEPGGPGTGGMEAECLATARPEICQAYFQFSCRTYGFALACAMAQVGNACAMGDRSQCDCFQGLLFANRDCFMGDQNGCAYLSQQPILTR